MKSFEALIQWLYLGRVVLVSSTSAETLSTIIEFARLADMCGVTGMESELAQRIKDIIVNLLPRPPLKGFPHGSNNTRHLTSRHIASAASLPAKHPVRGMIARASVEGLLSSENHQFAEKTQKHPKFGADLLLEVRVVLKRLALTSGVSSI
jgi:hypothetical protein